jgi:hypothetical protein
MLNNLGGTRNLVINALRRQWYRLSNELIQDVPEAIAVCEFDCRKTQCTNEEWTNCKRRLRKPVEELMPISRSCVLR